MHSARDRELLDRASRQFGAGNLAAAAAFAGKVLERDSADATANWILSAIHLRRGQPRTASQYAIAGAAPRTAKALGIEGTVRLATSLLECGETRAARDLLFTVDPTDHAQKPGLWGAARLLGVLDLPGRALELVDAIAAGQRNASVHHLRGSLLEMLGRPGEAAACYERAISRSPDFDLAHLALSQVGDQEGRASRIDRLRRLSRSGGSRAQASARLAYALFNELDAVDDVDGAWQELARGAALRASLERHDADGDARLHETIARTDASHPYPTRVPATSGPVPVFIVGMPRTGTTLVERILGNHPAVQACGELTALAQQLQWLEDRAWPGVLDDAAASRLDSLDAGRLEARYRGAMNWRLAAGRTHFTDKTPENYLALAQVFRAFPDARIVHVRRDAIDACFSNFKVSFAPGVYTYSYDFRHLAAHRRSHERLMSHWTSRYPGRIHTVDYEALVADPESVARELLVFCGLEPLAGLTDVAANREAVSTQSRNQVREPISRRYVSAWRRYAKPLTPLVDALSP